MPHKQQPLWPGNLLLGEAEKIALLEKLKDPFTERLRKSHLNPDLTPLLGMVYLPSPAALPIKEV